MTAVPERDDSAIICIGKIMRKASFQMFFLLLSVAVWSADLQQLNQQAGKSVVLLKIYDSAGAELGQGTGFVIQGGVIVTNHHVTEGGSRIEALTGEEKTLDILGLMADDEKNDLAILQAGPHHLTPLSLATQKPEVGTRVVVLGNPLGLSGTLSEGIISGIRPEGIEGEQPGVKETGPLLQISAPISPGSSGSPVLDIDGHVVGVAVSSYRGGQNLNFAIPVAMVAKLLNETKSGRLLKPLQARDTEKWVILRNVIISIAFFIVLIVVIRIVTRGHSG